MKTLKLHVKLELSICNVVTFDPELLMRTFILYLDCIIILHRFHTHENKYLFRVY